MSVLRLPVPILRIPENAGTGGLVRRIFPQSTGYSLVLFDRRRFPKLSRCRAIQVEANHPHPSLVQNLPLLLLRGDLGSRDLVKIQVRGDPTSRHSI